MIGADAINGNDPFARATTFPNELYRHLASRTIGPSEFLIAVTLEKFAYGDKRVCSPSVATLAGVTGLSERTVQLALKSLEAAGVIGRRFASGGRGRTTEYVLTGSKFGDGPAAKGADSCALSPPKGAENDARGRKTTQERAQISTEKGAENIPRINQGIIQGNTLSITGGEGEPKSEVKEAFNPGFHFEEQAPSQRLVELYNREVRPGTNGVAAAKTEVVRILVEHPNVTEAAIGDAIHCYAAEVASRPADKRKSALNFFREGHWQDFLDRPAPPSAEETEAVAAARMARQREETAELNKTRAAPAKLEKLRNDR